MALKKLKPEDQTAGFDLDDLRKKAESPSSVVSTVYHCTLVTPMFGGGVKAREVDENQPIRAAAIRGQLRFWWRLLNRLDGQGEVKESQALFEEEREIWGGLGDVKTLARSRVWLRVRNVKGVKTTPAAKIVIKKGKERIDWGELNDVSYVLFSATSADNSKPEGFIAKLLMPGARFDLEIGWHGPEDPKKWGAVREAVACWASFGGVGARTRRGCGAIKVTDATGVLLSLPKDRLEECGCQIRVTNEFGSAREAWRYAVGRLKKFRQGEGFARNAGDGKTPGQSRWPEADSIRRITGIYYRDETGKDHKPKNSPEVAFPRAFFGMPIITQFKDGNKKSVGYSDRLDPYDTELIPAELAKTEVQDKRYNRMASPLILRPVPAAGGKWRAVALCLPLDHLDSIGLVLRANDGKKDVKKRLARPDWWQDDFAKGFDPMRSRAEKNPLKAFMGYFSDGESESLDCTPSGHNEVGQHGGRHTFERPELKKISRYAIEVQVEGAKITLLRGEAEKCYSKLGDYARNRLDSNKKFNRLRLILEGDKFVDLKEYPE